MTLHLISRKRPVKIGEVVKNGDRLIGYVRKVIHVSGNRWNVLISGAGK